MVSHIELGRVANLLAMAEKAGAETHRGNGELPSSGYYLHPTVLTGATPDAAILTGEIFGPAAPVAQFGEAVKARGLGREGAHEGIHEFLETKHVALPFSEEPR